MQQGLGGRETALVQLGEQWARKGHEVINLVPVEAPYHRRFNGGGSVTYADNEITGKYLSNFGSEALISWEEPRLFSIDAIKRNIDFSVVEMQVAHLYVTMDDGESLDPYIDGYAVLSNWAGDFLVENEPNITKDKISVLPNGIDLARFPDPKFGHPGPGPYSFHYASSPDRGLHHLLNIWPRLREKYPDSVLHIAYGAEKWANEIKWSHNLQSEIALDVLEGLDQEGVINHGKIGQNELHQIIKQSDLLLYPCDTLQPTETGCITIIESLASGTPVVTTNADCIESEFKDVTLQSTLPFSEEAYLERIDYALTDTKIYEYLQTSGREFAETRSWDVISDQWITYLENGIAN